LDHLICEVFLNLRRTREAVLGIGTGCYATICGQRKVIDYESNPQNHPANFKAKVALAAFREDAPISELALKYGVPATVIHRWKREALASLEAGVSGRAIVKCSV